MTFTTFKAFGEWCVDNEHIDVMEKDLETNTNPHVTIHNINETSGQYIAEVLISAYDSGFIFGYFSVEENNGVLDIYEG